MKSKITREEAFLIKLHALAMKKGAFDEEIDRFTVGKALAQSHRAVDVMVRDLAQYNFIKKGEGDAIYLTPNGLSLVKKLTNE